MKICFCLHNHQPVGNFDHVMDSAYNDCYLPMLEVLENHSGIRTGLHISGTLLEWFAFNHPEYIERTGVLCRAHRMELLTSGRHEPVLTVFRKSDVVQQIKDYSSYLSKLSGSEPEGLWLTERVWEPQLPSVLSEAGVSWAVVDDIHLKRAGVTDLFRPCITEDSGSTLKLFGSNRELRYMIPFSPVERVMEKLKEIEGTGAELIFYGDDGEKFGVWPGTHKLCYEERWLDRFFTEVESADWLDSQLPSKVAETESAGPFYVPASSYTEMGEWTLHGTQRDEYDELRGQLDAAGKSETAGIFLSGGFWRNFLAIYPESKELHGRILSSEALVRESGDVKALHHFWRSQCNCAFWHGVFGGIYLPHLREALWKELHMAERIALKAIRGYPLIRTEDINADGFDETVIVSETQSLLVHPDRGLTVSELTFLQKDGEPVPFGHVLSRQREAYHEAVPGAEFSDDSIRTIHDDMPSKEDGLAARVTVDGWRRTSFSDIIMPGVTGWSDWKHCSGEITHFQKPAVSSSTEVKEAVVTFSGKFTANGLGVRKKITVGLRKSAIKAGSVYSVRPGDRVGMEICLNLMTGRSDDRYFRIDSGEKHLMSGEGEFHGSAIEVIDGWRKVKTVIVMNSDTSVWVTPLDSVNRSESGYESVHQGTAFYISGVADEAGSFRLKIGFRMEALNDSR